MASWVSLSRKMWKYIYVVLDDAYQNSGIEEPVATHGVAKFKRILQLDDYSCGSRSVQMVLRHFGIRVKHKALCKALKTDPQRGTHERAMMRVFREYALTSFVHPNLGMRGLTRVLARGGLLIVDYDGEHWAVVHGINDTHVFVADPSGWFNNRRRIPRDEFRTLWSGFAVAIYP